MERLKQRVDLASRVLKSLKEVAAIENPTAIERDAAIQRFEYTFEAVWKAAKQFLLDREGFDVASPKRVIRTCREVGLLDEAETAHALEMADDRNLTSHTYNEQLAQEIYLRIKQHTGLLEKWLNEMKNKAEN